jgi:hypothetical protein
MAEYSLEVKIGLYTTYTNIILVVTIWLNTLQKSREGFPLPTHKYNSSTHNICVGGVKPYLDFWRVFSHIVTTRIIFV